MDSARSPAPGVEKVSDRVPQARLYKVWNIPPYGEADTAYLELVERRAGLRQDLATLQAAGL